MKFKFIFVCGLCLISFSLINCSGNGSSSQMNVPIVGNPYLLKPTGPYEVGFKDYHYINTTVCPDVNYLANVNESYFSLNNPNFCHEIMVRIYYPAQGISKATYSYIYQPLIEGLEAAIADVPGINPLEIQKLSYLTSYTRENLPVMSNKFPVVFFSPAYGTQAQNNENIINQLVSYGFIVIAINSVFVSDDLQLPNGIIVPFSPAQSDIALEIQYSEVIRDLEFMYQQIHLQNNNDPIFAAMNLGHIGAFGHSIGARAIVDVAYQKPNWFQAISPLDEGFINPETYDVVLSVPILYQFSIFVYSKLESGTMVESHVIVPPDLIKESSYQVIFTPSLDNTTYSAHYNFADNSTLQYEPVLTKAIAYYGKIAFQVGDGNGFDLANSINTYLIQFFNFYLKGNESNPFSLCHALTESSILSCGPN